MSKYYRRKEPGPGEDLKAGMLAGVLGVAVAAVSFYLTRLIISRDTLEPLDPLDPSGSGEPAEKGARGGGI